MQRAGYLPVDLLDVDAAVLHSLDGVGEFDDLARGNVRVGCEQPRILLAYCFFAFFAFFFAFFAFFPPFFGCTAGA